MQESVYWYWTAGSFPSKAVVQVENLDPSVTPEVEGRDKFTGKEVSLVWNQDKTRYEEVSDGSEA